MISSYGQDGPDDSSSSCPVCTKGPSILAWPLSYGRSILNSVYSAIFTHGAAFSMYSQQQSRLLSIPPEIRLQIYNYLFNDGGEKRLAIRNKPVSHDPQSESRKAQAQAKRQSTRYNVTERTAMWHRRCHQTTYHLASSTAELHTAILSVCRLLYTEAADVLYGKHCFDFGDNLEAVVPFLADRTASTRQMVKDISLYKCGPLPDLGSTSDKYEWSHMCRYLAKTDTVTRMRIVVECGKPEQPWEGIQELSESDVRLLSLIEHESLEWVKDLVQVKNLEEIDVVPDVKYLPVPRSPRMVLYAALSASEKGLMGFLRSEMIKPY